MTTIEARRVVGRISLAWCLAIAGTGAAPAFAQTSSDSEASDRDTIIVTAQRRSERLEDVPAAIQAIDGEALRSAQITRFQDLQLITPSVQASRLGTINQLAIRGVTTSFAGGGQEANVAVYVDGFYNADLLSINQDFSNIESVEVLKGPQGTLYGRNATGGAILINTRSPRDTFEADVTVSYAPRFDNRKFEAYVGGPIASGVSFGVAGYWRKDDGYFRDINNFAPNAPIRASNPGKRRGNKTAPFENWSIRPKLVVEASPSVKLTLGYVHTFINDARSVAYRVIDHIPGNPTQYNGYPIATKIDTTSLNFQPVNQTETDEGNLTAEFGIGEFGTVTTRTSYRRQKDVSLFDLDATPRDPASGPGFSFTGYGNTTRKSFVQQIDFASNFQGDLSLLAGLFYYDDKYENRSFGDTGSLVTPVSPNVTDLDYKTEAWAAYVDATYNAGDLYVTVGGRYSKDKKAVRSVQVDAVGTVITAANSSSFTSAADATVRGQSSAFTPRAVVRYNLASGSNVYASVSRGFKSGTIANTAPYNILRPEKVIAYEVGFKSNSGGLRTEFSAFYYDFKNNQVAAADPTRPQYTSLLQNAGGQHNYGVDGMISYRVTERFNVRAAVSYLHARYVDFDNAFNVAVNPATNLNASVIGSWSGRRVIRAPDWSGSFSADYTADVADGKLTISGNVAFSSRYAILNASYDCAFSLQGGINRCNPGDYSDAPGRFEENGYVVANGQVSWTDSSEHYTLTLFASNITNERYLTSYSPLFYGDFVSHTEPRVIGGSVRFRY